jgi:serine kinase of HPr protein (carbohydrate metabolism regulator)
MGAVKELFLEGAKEYGWLDEHDNEKLKDVAKKLIENKVPIKVISDSTGLDEDYIRQMV